MDRESSHSTWFLIKSSSSSSFRQTVRLVASTCTSVSSIATNLAVWFICFHSTKHLIGVFFLVVSSTWKYLNASPAIRGMHRRISFPALSRLSSFCV